MSIGISWKKNKEPTEASGLNVRPKPTALSKTWLNVSGVQPLDHARESGAVLPPSGFFLARDLAHLEYHLHLQTTGMNGQKVLSKNIYHMNREVICILTVLNKNAPMFNIQEPGDLCILVHFCSTLQHITH